MKIDNISVRCDGPEFTPHLFHRLYIYMCKMLCGLDTERCILQLIKSHTSRYVCIGLKSQILPHSFLIENVLWYDRMLEVVVFLFVKRLIFLLVSDYDCILINCMQLCIML